MANKFIQLKDADGNLLYPRTLQQLILNANPFPDPPSANGVYVFTCIKTSSGVTYRWVEAPAEIAQAAQQNG